MVLEIRSVDIKVTIDSNKATDSQTFHVSDLDETLEEIREYVETRVEQAGR